AFDAEVRRAQTERAEWVYEMDLEHALAIGGIGRGAIDDFEKVDAVPIGLPAHNAAPQPRAASVNHAPPPCTRVSTARAPLRRTTYCTVTRSLASSVSTVTASTTIRSPSHCCSAPCTSTCVVAAITSLLGAKTSCKSPLPKSGRITRSPGL